MEEEEAEAEEGEGEGEGDGAVAGTGAGAKETLVATKAPRCKKVYHAYCMGFNVADDELSSCPRHACDECDGPADYFCRCVVVRRCVVRRASRVVRCARCVLCVVCCVLCVACCVPRVLCGTHRSGVFSFQGFEVPRSSASHPNSISRVSGL